MTPEEIVTYARIKGLAAIAITDHDTVSGNEEALREGRRQGLEVFPGVEVSILVPRGELHMLGYFIDHTDEDLHRQLSTLREHRKRRNPLIIQKLANLGIHLDLQEIRERVNNGNIGRPHIAATMVKAGYVRSIKDAFDRYLKKDGPAYVPKEILTAEEGIQLIRHNGGIPVLAHPYSLEIDDPDELFEYVRRLKEKGLEGIEAFYLGSSKQLFRLYEKIADRLGLCKTGGSDFHGMDKPGIEIGTGRGTERLPYRLAEDLKARRASLIAAPAPQPADSPRWAQTNPPPPPSPTA